MNGRIGRFLIMSLAILACLPLAACDVFIIGGPSATPTAVPTATPSGPSGGSGSRGSQSGVALISYTPKGSVTFNWIQSTHVLNTDLTLEGMTPTHAPSLASIPAIATRTEVPPSTNSRQ